MISVRLLADDLTGALDTAAEFTGLTGPVDVIWNAANPATLPASAALDLGTREASRAAACAAVAASVAALTSAGIAFKKIDSLLRGQTLPELAACFAAGVWTHCVLAPAFPYQDRITRGGQQFMAVNGKWISVGPPLVTALRALGVSAQADAAGVFLPGITVFDAETDADLGAAVAKAGGVGAKLLWCGTGGLAGALAGHEVASIPELPRPILGLFGSDQPVTAAQLAACAPHWLTLQDGSAQDAARLARALDRHGLALASHDMPSGTPRAAAAERIGRVFSAALHHLPKPGTLVVAGGETLRFLCQALGAHSLQVLGRAVPGVPVSRLRGGAWDGVTVLSKSGAFGPPNLLRDLLRIPEFERTAQ